jgi:hypothetical protein
VTTRAADDFDVIRARRRELRGEKDSPAEPVKCPDCGTVIGLHSMTCSHYTPAGNLTFSTPANLVKPGDCAVCGASVGTSHALGCSNRAIEGWRVTERSCRAVQPDED